MSDKTKILVIDDEPTVCATFEKGLSKQGYYVEVARNMETAMEKLEFFQPRLVLLDIHMPKVWGDDILKKIKSVRPQIQVVMVTGVVDEILHEKCLRSGAYAVIKKPVDFKLLYETIERALVLNSM